MVTAMVLDKPETPVPFMVRWLAGHNAKAKAHLDSLDVGQAEVLKTEVARLQEELKGLKEQLDKKQGGSGGGSGAPDQEQSAAA